MMFSLPSFHSSEARSNHSDPHAHGPRARYANMALGFWLFVSAFSWPHMPSTRINTCMVGLFVAIAATLATGLSILRQLTTVLALWLLLTTLLVYPASPMTFWNNVLVSLAALAFSLIPSASEQASLSDRSAHQNARGNARRTGGSSAHGIDGIRPERSGRQ